MTATSINHVSVLNVLTPAPVAPGRAAPLRPGISVRTGLVLLILIAAVTLVSASTATATTVAVRDGVLEVTGDPGHNAIAVVLTGGASDAILVRDVFAPVRLAGPECDRAADNMVTCPLDSVAGVVVHLGDGDDELLSNVPLPLTAYGEAGVDWLTALPAPRPWTPQPATLDGGDGNDRVEGGPADDTLRGGAGNDGLDGLGGNDLLDPGTGRDSVRETSGDDRIDAADGEADYVDCGPGRDIATFDAFDIAIGCESGVLPVAPTPDCTPDVERLTRSSLRTLLRTGSITIPAAVEPPCALRARITGGRRVLTSATPAAHHPVVRLRLGPRALRRARAAHRLTLIVSASASGAKTITRTFHLPRPEHTNVGRVPGRS